MIITATSKNPHKRTPDQRITGLTLRAEKGIAGDLETLTALLDLFALRRGPDELANDIARIAAQEGPEKNAKR